MGSMTASAELAPRSLLSSFGIASLVVVLGVAGAWVFIKSNSEQTVTALPPLPKFAWAQSAVATGNEDLPLLERAEAAFAAGRIAEPEGNNAFAFYSAAVAETPDDEAARAGLERTISYMIGTAESAVFRNEWSRAERLARQILAAAPSHQQAGSLLSRTLRFQKIEQLTAQAASYLASGQLDSPVSENAVSTYRRMLRLDGANVVAAQGLDTVAGRFLANAQTAAFAGELDQAKAFIARAEAVMPDHNGLQSTRKMIADWNKVNQNQALQSQLLAAADALQEDRLIGRGNDTALALYTEVLKSDPKSEAAQRGKLLVAEALLDRAWTQLRAGDRDAASVSMANARTAGAASASLLELEKELSYQTTLAKAREGEFDTTLPISSLKVVRRANPDYPKQAAKKDQEGWVEVMFTVSVDGEVVDAAVHKSSDSVFDRSALTAIERWRFEPYRENDRLVPVRSGVRFAFRP